MSLSKVHCLVLSLCCTTWLDARGMAFGFQARSTAPCRRRNLQAARTAPSPALYADSSGYDDGLRGSHSTDTDWLEAQFTLRNFPPEPHPDLSPDQVAVAVCRSLQFVDHPAPSAGLKRVFPFFTWECRKTVTARRGGDTPERFAEHGAFSPALQPFMGASRIDLGEGTLSPGTATRGDIITFPVVVRGAAVLAFQHKSGMIRDRVGEVPPRTDMVMRLEKTRRPPLRGCWLVREMLDVRYAFAGDMGNVHVGG